MEEQLISFETAKLAFEKQYSNSCYTTYKDNKRTNYLNTEEDEAWENNFNRELIQICKENNLEYILEYERPTQNLLQKWLREVHQIDAYVNPIKTMLFDKRDYQMRVLTEDSLILGVTYNSYEECLEQALIKALKLIKPKEQ